MMYKLTEKQHDILRELIQTSMSVRVIAVKAGVSQGTVTNFRRACMTVNEMSDIMREKVRMQLSLKTSVPQIAANLNVPVENVWCLRRLDRFRVATETICKECGTVFFMSNGSGTESVDRREKMRGRISLDNTRLLCDIALNLLELSDLHLISNPLFHHLAQRAEKVYKKIHGK